METGGSLLQFRLISPTPFEPAEKEKEAIKTACHMRRVFRNSELSKEDFSRSPDSQQSRNVRIYFSQRASDFQPTSSHGSGVSAAVSDPNHLSSLLFLQSRVSLFFFFFLFVSVYISLLDFYLVIYSIIVSVFT